MKVIFLKLITGDMLCIYYSVLTLPFIDNLINKFKLRFTKLPYSTQRLLFFVASRTAAVLLEKDIYDKVYVTSCYDLDLESWLYVMRNFDKTVSFTVKEV